MTTDNFEMDKIDDRLAKMYTSDEDKQAKYDDWASSYESDLVNEMDYVAHIDASKVFQSLVPQRESKILDVACGTGLVGEELQNMGYVNVDGCDFSAEMINVSRDRKVYQQLFQHDFTQPLENQRVYDALICVGLFSFSIPRIHHMIHVINAVKPNGLCVITVNGAAWRELDHEQSVRSEAEKHNFIIEDIISAGYIQKENIDSKILIIRKP